MGKRLIGKNPGVAIELVATYRTGSTPTYSTSPRLVCNQNARFNHALDDLEVIEVYAYRQGSTTIGTSMDKKRLGGTFTLWEYSCVPFIDTASGEAYDEFEKRAISVVAVEMSE